VLILEGNKLRGVFAAAQSPIDPTLVVSHPGITFGGIVHQGWLTGERMLEALVAMSDHYRNSGYQQLLYKAIPFIFFQKPSQDDLYALFRLGAQRVRCDLSCSIDLPYRQAASGRRQRELNKTLQVVTLSDDQVWLDALWSVITDNLARKHHAKPVHTLTDLKLLASRFPAQIFIRCALMAGRVEAGIILFNADTVWHVQYVGASHAAYEVSALDAVFESTITEAQQAGARYFDFGISNENNGLILNEGLYRFKSGFGGGGVAHEFYEINFAHAR